MTDKIPDILLPALRQYQHNDCSGLLAGFDYDETVKIVTSLQRQFVESACATIEMHPTLNDFCKGKAIKALREKLDL